MLSQVTANCPSWIGGRNGQRNDFMTKPVRRIYGWNETGTHDRLNTCRTAHTTDPSGPATLGTDVLYPHQNSQDDGVFYSCNLVCVPGSPIYFDVWARTFFALTKIIAIITISWPYMYLCERYVDGPRIELPPPEYQSGDVYAWHSGSGVPRDRRFISTPKHPWWFTLFLYSRVGDGASNSFIIIIRFGEVDVGSKDIYIYIYI